MRAAALVPLRPLVIEAVEPTPRRQSSEA